MTVSEQDRITRDDIEEKMRELQGAGEFIADEAMNYAIVAGAVVLVAVVAVSFWLGRRRGRRNRTVVEIRRF